MSKSFKLKAIDQIEDAEVYCLFSEGMKEEQEITIYGRLFMTYIADRLEFDDVMATMGVGDKFCNVWIAKTYPELYKIVVDSRDALAKVTGVSLDID